MALLGKLGISDGICMLGGPKQGSVFAYHISVQESQALDSQ